jgi:hypothetical protein
VSQAFAGHWDPSEHTYFPPDLDRVLTMRAPTDTLWPTDTLVARSGHAPPTIRLMRSLQHQAAVFPSGQNMLVVVGGAKTDKLSAAKPMTAALFLLDANLNVVAKREATVTAAGDSMVFVGEMPVPPSARFFSAEAYDSTTRYAARARFRLEPPASSGKLALSGILLTKPFEAGNLPATRKDASAAPLTRPVVTPGQKLGVYAEVDFSGEQVQTVNVALEVRPIDHPSGVTRLAGWIGSKLGFSAGTQTPGKLGWTLELQPHQPNPIALTIDPGKLDRGRYLITVTVTDPIGNGVVLAEREFFISPEH